MKTRKMIVPRYVIERHNPHPEFYGESIVLLENGMTTDVYTNVDGSLYTETNHKDLIDYLKTCKKIEEDTLLKKGLIQLTSLNVLDQEQLQTWFGISPIRRFDLLKDSDEMTRQYISHSKTKNSEVFMMMINQIKVGIIGYTQIDQVAISHAEIYKHKCISKNEMNYIIQLFVQYLKNKYLLFKIIFLTNEYDDIIIEVLNQNNFTRNQKTPILRSSIIGYIIEHEYEHMCSII